MISKCHDMAKKIMLNNYSCLSSIDYFEAGLPFLPFKEKHFNSRNMEIKHKLKKEER